MYPNDIAQQQNDCSSQSIDNNTAAPSTTANEVRTVSDKNVSKSEDLNISVMGKKQGQKSPYSPTKRLTRKKKT